jgi:hypothetical protein
MVGHPTKVGQGLEHLHGLGQARGLNDMCEVAVRILDADAHRLGPGVGEKLTPLDLVQTLAQFDTVWQPDFAKGPLKDSGYRLEFLGTAHAIKAAIQVPTVAFNSQDDPRQTQDQQKQGTAWALPRR